MGKLKDCNFLGLISNFANYYIYNKETGNEIYHRVKEIKIFFLSKSGTL